MKALFNKKMAVVSGLSLTALVSGAANAAIDTAAVQSAITAVEGSALTTGEYVIGTVASLVVISLIIGIVKKL